MDDLGSRIRTERKRRKMTLKELAEKSSLSLSFLSEIERNVSRPSISSLRKIAQSLGVSLMSFNTSKAIQEEAAWDFSTTAEHQIRTDNYITDVRVVRVDQRKRLGYPGDENFYELLTPDLNRKLQVLYSKARPGEYNPTPVVDPPGEKFLYVLKGEWEYTINGERYHLHPGDSIYYPANSPISWRVLGKEPGETILVLTPPGF